MELLRGAFIYGSTDLHLMIFKINLRVQVARCPSLVIHHFEVIETTKLYK